LRVITVSVITACYNAATTLPDTLTSIHSQTHPAVESVVIDGNSVDGTVEVIRALHGGRGPWISEPDAGIYDALNKGIRRSSGDVVGFLHADDTLAHPRVLADIAACFEDPEVEACYGDLVYVRREDPETVVRYWRSQPFKPDRLRRGWMPPHPTLYMRRSLYDRHGGFDTRYRIAADYDNMLRLLTRVDGRVVYLPEVLVRMRLGGASNRSLHNIWRKSVEDYQALRVNHVGGWQALAIKNLSKLPQFIRRGKA
jgi:glycosyltransferase